MRFIPFRNLEDEAPGIDTKSGKPAVGKPQLNADGRHNIAQCIDIIKKILTKLTPDQIWNDFVSPVNTISESMTLEDVEMYYRIVSNPEKNPQWAGFWAFSGGTFVRLLEYLELSNGYKHISPNGDTVTVQDIYPKPADPRNARFLADLIFYASKTVGISTKLMKELLEDLPEGDRHFAPKFIAISYICFAAVFYANGFINPTLIDAWSQIFELKIDSPANEVLDACQHWWDNPPKLESEDT